MTSPDTAALAAALDVLGQLTHDWLAPPPDMAAAYRESFHLHDGDPDPCWTCANGPGSPRHQTPAKILTRHPGAAP